MQNAESLSQEQIREFLRSSGGMDFRACGRAEIYAWTERVLVAQEFGGLRKKTTRGGWGLPGEDDGAQQLANDPLDQGSQLRTAAASTVRWIMSRKDVMVRQQSHASFLAGLRLYESRADKGYSLVDCISMQTMRRERIQGVLTNDHHFEQEGSFAS